MPRERTAAAATTAAPRRTSHSRFEVDSGSVEGTFCREIASFGLRFEVDSGSVEGTFCKEIASFGPRFEVDSGSVQGTFNRGTELA